MRKRVFLSFLLLFLSMGFLGAAGKKEEGLIQVGVAMNDFSTKWHTYVQEGMRKFEAEHEDLLLTMTDARGDPALQLSQVETLIAQGADAVVLVPAGVSEMLAISEQVKLAKIPFVVVDRLPGEEVLKNVDVFIGSPSVQAGNLQGERLLEVLGPGEGQLGIILGPLGHENTIMRTQGVKDIIEGTRIKVIAAAEGRWERSRGLAIAENWFQSGKKFDAIICNNDEMAIGALLAAEAAGIKDEDIFIAGIDATPDALEFVGKGLDMTVFQDAYAQGYGGVKAAYELIQGERPEKMQWIPFEPVTLDNKDDYTDRYNQ